MEIMDIDYRKLGQNIRAVRNGQRMTQKQVYVQIGIGASYYSHIESGDVKVGLTTLYKISQILGVTIDSLLFGKQVTDAVFADALQRATAGYNDNDRQFVLNMLENYNSTK